MPKRLPLPKRFPVAMTEAAYRKLRELNERFGLGNNYLLTLMLEQFDRFADADKFEAVFQEFKAKYGAPDPGKGM